MVDEEVSSFIEEALFATVTNVNFDMESLLELLLECGRKNLRVMEMLDEGHTKAYGQPSPTQVYEGTKEGPGILVTGHDMVDLADLLEQTAGTGVNVYTHGEMLPAHWALLHAHLEGLISGEIGAPIGLRMAAIDFVRKNPDYAAAYSSQLMSRALSVNVAIAPILTIPELTEINERLQQILLETAPPVKPESPPAAARMVGDNDTLAWELFRQRTIHRDKIDELAEFNPKAFGSEAMRQAISAASRAAATMPRSPMGNR